jgi:hypothetical protein
MLKIIRFGKHYICCLQGEYVMVLHFGSLITGQEVGAQLDIFHCCHNTETQETN